MNDYEAYRMMCRINIVLAIGLACVLVWSAVERSGIKQLEIERMKAMVEIERARANVKATLSFESVKSAIPNLDVHDEIGGAQ